MHVLLPSPPEPGFRDRLDALGLPFRVIPEPVVPELESQSTQWVFVVDEPLRQSARWPQVRVQLARANRFFIQVVPSPDTARVADAMRDGAHDVVAASDADGRWIAALKSAAQAQELWWHLYGSRSRPADDRLVGGSRAMADLRRDIHRLGPTDVTVLILGESGSGKERIAAALHASGTGGPFVTLNCAAMPRDLLESELFGSERGAFTGSLRSRPGLVEQAHGGTLFLDEIGELDLALQPKLLRFLETRTARRVGGDREYSVKLRVISATNRNLENDVGSGHFRPDLYYRLAEVILRPPPLRDRLDDLPELARVFLDTANERFGKNIATLEPGLLRKFQSHSWPGNVRELKSVIDRLVLFHDGPVLREGWWDCPQPIPNARTELSSRFGILPPQTRIPSSMMPGNALESASMDPLLASGQRLPTRADRVAMARQLLTEPDLSLAEVAARTGVHPTTLFRWRKAGRV